MMIKNLILEKSGIPLLSKSLDVYGLRHKAIASNIANVTTPGYRRKEVRFEDALRSQLQKRLVGNTNAERHIPLGSSRITEVQPELLEDPSRIEASGVNNVDIDEEIVEQIKNEIRYMYAARMVSGKFDGLRASIKGRFDG